MIGGSVGKWKWSVARLMGRKSVILIKPIVNYNILELTGLLTNIFNIFIIVILRIFTTVFLFITGCRFAN